MTLHITRVTRSHMPRNLTLSIDDDLLAKARVLAAVKRTSVNEMVRGFLQKAVEREAALASRAEAWARRFEGADNTAAQRDARRKGASFDRDALYEEAMRERGLL